MFIIKLLSQHVSGIIMPISRRTIPRVTAYGVMLRFCWMWLVAVVGRCVVGCEHSEDYCSTVTFVVLASCVQLGRKLCALCKVTVTFTQCTQLTVQLHTTTASTTSAEHHMQ